MSAIPWIGHDPIFVEKPLSIPAYNSHDDFPDRCWLCDYAYADTALGLCDDCLRFLRGPR